MILCIELTVPECRTFDVHILTAVAVCRVTFKGEMGVDYGGIKREFFTNTMKEIISHTSVLAPCSNGRLLWFTNQSSTFAPASCTTRKVPRLDHAADVGHSDHSEPAEDTSAGNKYADLRPKRRLAYYLGLVVGMAAYNGVHVDVPLPSCVYKTMKGLEVMCAFVGSVQRLCHPLNVYT